MELRPGNPEEAGMSAERIRRVRQRAADWVAEGATPALVVLAAHRGIVVLHEAFGRLTPDADSPPLERDSIFPLASLSKPITATAIMILVEDGLVGLNRPVAEYVSEFVGEGKDAVLVHHLLTHTSGLRQFESYLHAERKRGRVDLVPIDELYRGFFTYFERTSSDGFVPSGFTASSQATAPLDATQHPIAAEYLSLRYDAPLSTPPGAEMSYLDDGFDLLGEIVRRVSGQSLTDFARERIFEPLGMKDTSYTLPEVNRRRAVRRPADAPWQSLDSPVHQEVPWGDGTVYSTALDIAVFGQTLLGGGRYGNARVLSRASVAEMTRNQIPGISARFGDEVFPEAGWGLGWSIHGNKRDLRGGSLQSPETFSHGGAGFVQLWVDPTYDLVGAYFCVQIGEASTRGASSARLDLFQNMVTAAIVDE